MLSNVDVENLAKRMDVPLAFVGFKDDLPKTIKPNKYYKSSCFTVSGPKVLKNIDFTVSGQKSIKTPMVLQYRVRTVFKKQCFYNIGPKNKLNNNMFFMFLLQKQLFYSIWPAKY